MSAESFASRGTSHFFDVFDHIVNGSHDAGLAPAPCLEKLLLATSQPPGLLLDLDKLIYAMKHSNQEVRCAEAESVKINDGAAQLLVCINNLGLVSVRATLGGWEPHFATAVLMT